MVYDSCVPVGGIHVAGEAPAARAAEADSLCRAGGLLHHPIKSLNESGRRTGKVESSLYFSVGGAVLLNACLKPRPMQAARSRSSVRMPGVFAEVGWGGGLEPSLQGR